MKLLGCGRVGRYLKIIIIIKMASFLSNSRRTKYNCLGMQLSISPGSSDLDETSATATSVATTNNGVVSNIATASHNGGVAARLEVGNCCNVMTGRTQISKQVET